MEMDISGTSEIVESNDRKAETCPVPKLGIRFSIEDDINRLFEAIDIRNSAKGVGLHHGGSKEMLQKKAMKRPIRAGSPQSTGIGISEPVSLKQALRGLCISQASELAAMKRLSRPASSSGTSEAGNIKRLYRAVVVETNGSGLPMNEGKGNLVEFSLVPERINSISPENLFALSGVDKAESSGQSAHYSNDHVTCLPSSCGNEISSAEGERPNTMDSPSVSHDIVGVKEVGMMASDPVKVLEKASVPEERKSHKDATSSLSSSRPDSLVKTLACNSPRFIKPIFGNKNFSRKKGKQDSSSSSSSWNTHNEKVDNSRDPGTSNSGSSTTDPALGNAKENSANDSSQCSSMDHSVEVNSSKLGICSHTIPCTSNITSRPRFILEKIDEKSRLKEKGEFSQSSKSSIGDYSSSTSLSEDSSLSGSSRSGNRPHMSRDLRWEAIRQIQKQHRSLCLKHFKLVKKLGCGDIGSVYLAELSGTNCLFALKVMDNEFLASRKKMPRAQTEKEILQMLDHPFLPTLYAHFVSDKLSCLVMEYCPGGDLHVLRQKQAGRSFSEQAVRFYAAEVLLAIEYLHMLGVVYRDLKPENVLVREDGHIMLSDFDLSLRCSVNPIVVQSSSPVEEPTRKTSSPCSESSCIEPFCLHPAWQVSCFTPRLLSVASKSRRMKSDLAAQMSPLPQLVVEPTSARSNSFVGTYEYLAPEIIKSEGHGSAVDWWTFGIFLFELLYGRTPFKGSGNEETLSNVVSRSLRFPSSAVVTFHARDLIRGLLVKEPENRLGSGKGAAEIKQHSFFEGLNWALIRCAVPPELPKPSDIGTGAPTTFSQNKEDAKCNELKVTDDYTEFEMF